MNTKPQAKPFVASLIQLAQAIEAKKRELERDFAEFRRLHEAAFQEADAFFKRLADAERAHQEGLRNMGRLACYLNPPAPRTSLDLLNEWYWTQEALLDRPMEGQIEDPRKDHHPRHLH